MLVDPSFLMQFPGIVLYKDKNSRFLGCSSEFSNLLGYKKPELAIGSTDYELPCDAVKNANAYLAEDQRVIKENKKLSFLQISRFADGLTQALYYEKAPLINFKKSQVVGVLCQGFAIKGAFLSNIYKVFSAMSNRQQFKTAWLGNYTIETEVDCLSNFSQREMECLFYLLRGKSAKEIAKTLAISSRTVETYLENLKFKTNSQSKGELINFCFQQGYQNKMPQSIFCGLMDEK